MYRSFTLSPFSKSAAVAPQDNTCDTDAGYALLDMLPQGDKPQVGLALFLIYVTASELNHLFGNGELRRLLFTHRPFELQLNRRQRIRELVRLSRLADTHRVEEFRDSTSARIASWSTSYGGSPGE